MRLLLRRPRGSLAQTVPLGSGSRTGVTALGAIHSPRPRGRCRAARSDRPASCQPRALTGAAPSSPLRADRRPRRSDCCPLGTNSVDYDQERLPFLDDVRRELRGMAAADVPDRVDGFGRNHQRLAGVVRPRGLAVDLVLQRPVQDVDDLLARVLVPDGGRLRSDFNEVLDHLAPGDAEVVLLKIGAVQARCLLNPARCLLECLTREKPPVFEIRVANVTPGLPEGAERGAQFGRE